ncbi:MAG: DUF4105 domain-containing protein, partial [Rothia sp. (in: high G+C Gram-positive bacteria)]|uniref:lipoprotein N-acyltransferase Lnb domain-containing protein n=1 Tax=Rothia sp. (in: high G+C Gram-positive bacteria) TaxID=1885016 RepID=UPI0026DFF9BF
MKRLLILLYISCLALLAATAQTVDGPRRTPPIEVQKDSVKVSLLTISAGDEIYTLYGHTALRVREKNEAGWSDWVFNYGTFSFAQPHFIWRFMLGKTDYQLGVVPYQLFFDTYAYEGRGIYEQQLNLSQPEGRDLVNRLAVNLHPDSVTYRYNFLYDNCVTRVIRRITQSVSDGQIIWPTAEAMQTRDLTLRDIVHQYAEEHPWDALGQDLLLGSEVDHPASLQAQMFAPFYAQRYIAKARIKHIDGTSAPLAGPVHTLLAPAPRPQQSTGVPSPMTCFGLLLALTLIVSAVEWV